MNIEQGILVTILGSVLTFILILLKEQCQRKQQEREYFEVLLSQLEDNKKLADKNIRVYYHTLNHIDAKESKHLLSLPQQLREEIQNIQNRISLLDSPSGVMERQQLTGELKNLLNNAISQLKKYLNKG